MSKQTEAQRLAADLNGIFVSEEIHASKASAIAAELLRQEALIEELAGALREITTDYSDRFDLDSPSTNPGIKSSIEQARAALAKVQP